MATGAANRARVIPPIDLPPVPHPSVPSPPPNPSSTPHVDDLQVLVLLLDEQVFVELLDEVDLLVAVQQVRERAQRRPVLDGQNLQRHVARLPLVDEQHDARAERCDAMHRGTQGHTGAHRGRAG